MYCSPSGSLPCQNQKSLQVQEWELENCMILAFWNIVARSKFVCTNNNTLPDSRRKLKSSPQGKQRFTLFLMLREYSILPFYLSRRSWTPLPISSVYLRELLTDSTWEPWLATYVHFHIQLNFRSTNFKLFQENRSFWNWTDQVI